jgi:2'-5' RNA ligase
MNPSAKVRLFVALKPPEEWIKQLATVATELRTQLRSKEIKWVQPEQIHITLRFLGYILPDEVAAVVQGVNRAAAGEKPFVLRAGALGCFPSVRRARVLWIGVEDSQQLAAELQRKISDQTASLGEPPEDRDFTPHLTLARIKHVERSAAEALERMLERPVGLSRDWNVSEVLLMQSHLSSAGARYEVLHSAALGS